MRPEVLSDLDEPGGAVAAIDATLVDVVDRAKDPTPYAWRFRCPGTPTVPRAEEAGEALAREVHSAILARLPLEVRP
jgi:hypothetical protein